MKTLTLALLLLAPLAQAEDNDPNATEKITPLRGNVYLIEGAGGNVTASIGGDGVLLIDDDFSWMAGKLLQKIQETQGKSLDSARPRLIVNTHFHYDHTGGNEVFGPTSVIVAATPVRDRLKTEQVLWHENHPAYPNQALPLITFDRALSLHFNGEELQLKHLPSGHTDGDTFVYFTHSRVLSAGDLYFASMYPLFHPEHGGSITGYLKNLCEMIRIAAPDAIVVPGHGPLSNRAELIRYQSMIQASVGIVRSGIRRGLTLRQIQTQGLPSRWESYSHGFRSTDE